MSYSKTVLSGPSGGPQATCDERSTCVAPDSLTHSCKKCCVDSQRPATSQSRQRCCPRSDSSARNLSNAGRGSRNSESSCDGHRQTNGYGPPSRTVWLLSTVFFTGVLLLPDVQGAPEGPPLKLTTPDDSYIHGIEGFGTRLHCRVNTCVGNSSSTVQWYKDEKLIAEGQQSFLDATHAIIDYNAFLNHSRDCGSTCSDSSGCPIGQHCLDNACCYCTGEEFNLFLKNLSISDGGHYHCQLKDDARIAVDLELDVVESGLQEGFHRNLTYNYTECCKRQNVRPECQPLCNIGNADVHQLDLMSCESDIPKFLHCASNGGNISHMHCCRLQLVPPFCWDFCMGSTADFKSNHRLCTYWLSEILECYEQAYLPYAGPPENVVVNTKGPDSLQVCWKAPTLRGSSVTLYTVHYRELPRFPFFNGPSFASPDQEEGPGAAPPGMSPDDFEHEVERQEIDVFAPVTTTEPNAGPFRTSRRPGPNVWRRRDHDLDSSSQQREPRSAEEMVSDFAHESDQLMNGVASEHNVGWPGGSRYNPTGLHFRAKRQSWVFITHNVATNETFVKEFPFHEINTTARCVIIDKLNPSTQYFVYVTSLNDYGTSLPSTRALAVTAAEAIQNSSMPDIVGCCRKNGVSPQCVPKLCNLGNPPSALAALDIALNCRAEFPDASPCLADGRNHTQCCRSKGVSGDCLKLCSGTPATLGISAVVCLSVDMYNVYSCLRQGYVYHPSPPQNVSIFEVRSRSAKVKWDPPATNADKVKNYTLFYKTDDDRGWHELQNASSPHELVDLLANTPYLVYVVAFGANGSSLRSSAESFRTKPNVRSACRYGQPIKDSVGNLVPCDTSGTCPRGFECRNRLDVDSFCCPLAPGDLSPVAGGGQQTTFPNISSCCSAKGADPNCLPLCSYNTTMSDLLELGSNCIKDVRTWVDCGADGRDHRPCCLASGVPENCLNFCFPPLKEVNRGHITCLPYVDPIVACGRRGIMNLPGPPVDFHLSSLSESVSNFSWLRPFQNTTVEYYIVLVTDHESGRVIQKNTTELFVSVTDLTPTHEYEATAVAYNKHGNSAPGTNITFVVESDSDMNDGDVKPEPPYSLEAISSSASSVNVSWSWSGRSVSQKLLSNVSFVVNYGENVQDRKTSNNNQVYTSARWITLNLQPNKNYQVYVVAINTAKGRNVTSLHSEIIDVFAGVGRKGQMPSSEPEIRITLTPQKDVYGEGDKIVVSCASFFPDANFHPVLTLTVSDVDTKGVGNVSYEVGQLKTDVNRKPIQCSAETPNGRLTSKVNLKVSYIPIVSKVKQDAVKIIEGTGFKVDCNVKSFPTPTVSWFWTSASKPAKSPPERNITSGSSDSRKFSTLTDNHFNTLTETTWDEDRFIASLTTDSAVEADAGFYHCKACNTVGCSDDYVEVKIDPFPIPWPPLTVQQCCVKEGVKKECQSACSSEIDISAYENNTKCLEEFPKLLRCAKDGHDHTTCCLRRGVIQDCLGYCDDAMDSLVLSKLDARCADFSQYILRCLEEKHGQAPSAPRNLGFKRLNGTAINATWDAPARNTDSVELYAVFYRKAPSLYRDGSQRSGYDTTKWTLAKAKKTWVVVDDLDPRTTYVFRVAAGSHQGYFEFSPEATMNWTSLAFSSVTSDGSRFSDAGRPSAAHSGAVAIGIIFLLLLCALVVILALYVRRRPELLRKLPIFFGPRLRGVPNGAVAFENPGYDKDGRIRGLPGDAGNGSGSAQEFDNGWQSPNLSPPDDDEPTKLNA